MRRKGTIPEEKVNDPKGIVDGFRQVIQDLLVPELKAIQATLQHHGELFRMLQEEMNRRFEEERQRTDERFTALQREIAALREDMDKRFTALQQEMDRRFTAFQEQMDKRFAAMDERFAALQQEMDKRFTALQQEMDRRFTAFQEQMDKRFAASQQEMDRRFAALQQEMDRRFNEVHEVLRTILQRLDIVDVVKEIQIRQKALEEQVAYLRELLLISFQQRGIQPPPKPEGGANNA